MIPVHQKLFPALLFLLIKKLAYLLGFGVEEIMEIPTKHKILG